MRATPAAVRPRPLRRVGVVAGMLLLAQAAAGVLLARDAGAPVALVLVAAAGAMLPGAVAALTLLPRGPGGVTGADLVTMLRQLAAGALAGVAVLVLAGVTEPRSWPLLVAGSLALGSDGVDGAVARRTGTAGPVGALIDMEADAALVLVLSVIASAVVGPWALAIGLMRYAFLLAGRLRPALRGPLAPNLLRRVIGLFQGAALLAALAPGMPREAAVAVVGAALGLLVLSFGRDVIALERAAR